MAAKAVNVTVPSDGSVVAVTDDDGDLLLGNDFALRNTGAVKLLVGGNDGNCVLPLGPNATDNDLGEFLGLNLTEADMIKVKVKTAGTAGQLTVLKTR